jgi:hypothetical protein
MVNRYNISIKLQAKILQSDPWAIKKDYNQAVVESKCRCGFNRLDRRRGMPSFLLLQPIGTLDFDSNI